MSAGLLCLAAALVCWPRPTARVVRRLGRRGRPARAVLPGGWTLAPLGGLAAALLATPVVGLLVAGCLAVALRAWRRRAGDRDLDRQVRALAEALGVLAAELRAGRPAEEATRTAVAACPHPVVAGALAPALRSGTVDDVVPEASRAVLARVAAAAVVSARTGCSLAAVVGAAEDDLRARLATAAELRSAVAGPRASGVVLAGLPVLGLLMGAGVGADPWRVLTTTGTGTLLLVAGVGLEVAGLAWTGRLVRRAARA
ncbi:type II secretion system F family protein [Modestobacter sp. Leaf380]|uniref:type II secretion system F family protein n=1 Tax=Modestobacter sp. Leaf380 TaxID=1736356 RepID=UPI0006FBC233|nr:type II secretion system F family protein [Modestobacter sp. Leaf380]KQS68621.1 hypothetical protein ASG41_06725 [Modestobacter sp. Leaf380]